MSPISKSIRGLAVANLLASSVLAQISTDSFETQRAALIEKHSSEDPVFEALLEVQKQEDTFSSTFWQWKIDQYLYGQYTEFQPIYDSYKEGKSFSELYDIGEESLIDRASQLVPKLHALPEGYFSGYLPGDREPGWSHYSEGKIYVAYEGDLTDPYIASFDTESHTWEGPYKAGHSTLSKNGRKSDSHGKPAMEQDNDGYLHIIFGGHGGEREDGLNPHSIDTAHAGGRFTHIVSDKPNDISSFSVKHDVSPFASYAESCKMANGDIYFFTRAGTHKSPWLYYKLKNGSQTLEPPVAITWPTARKGNPIMVDMFYVKIFKASDTEIIITSMNHLCNFKEIHTPKHDDRFNAYYMKMDTSDDTFYNIEGDQLNLPITKSYADQHTLVYDSVKDGTIVNDTKGLLLEDGTYAMSYELRFPEPRQWKLATHQGGKWTTGLPMPGTQSRTLVSTTGDPFESIVSIETLKTDEASATAAVVYKNEKKETVFAIAESSIETGIVGQNWKIRANHLSLRGSGMKMKVVKNDAGESVGVVVNVSKGKTRRLYLWHDGAIHPNSNL